MPGMGVLFWQTITSEITITVTSNSKNMKELSRVERFQARDERQQTAALTHQEQREKNHRLTKIQGGL